MFTHNTSLDDCLASLKASGLFDKLYSDVDVNGYAPATRHGEEGRAFVVFHADVQRMVDMHLGHLPVRVVSVPYGTQYVFPKDVFPALQLTAESIQKHKGEHVFDMKQQLSLLFPTKFIAALYELQSLFHRFQLKGYLIGGIARDMILTEDNKVLIRDVDITVEGQGDEAAQAVDSHSRNFSVLEKYAEFGTAKLRYKDMIMLDFASTRLETYDQSGALPTITKRGVSLYQDIRRRDFSVNTLGLAIHDVGMLYDYVNGLKDLEARSIHVLTGATFFEDPSRILRAFKFANRLDFTLSPQTEWLIHQFLCVTHKIPFRGGGSRVKESLKEWLSLTPSPLKHQLFVKFISLQGLRTVMTAHEDHSPFTLSFEQRQTLTEACKRLTKLWDVTQDNLQEIFKLESPFCDPLDPDTCNERALWHVYTCYIFYLFQDDKALSERLMHRLELTKECRGIIQHFLRLYAREPFKALDKDASPADLCKAFDGVDSIALVAYTLQQPNAKEWLEPLVQYLKRWRNLKPQLSGDALLEMGVPEGEDVGKCLKGIRTAYLTGHVSDLSDEQQFVKEFIHKLPAPKPNAEPKK